MSHADYEAVNPVDAAAEVEYDQARRIQHVKTHGTLDGYRPLREFPCPGQIEVVDRSEAMWVLACTGCRFELAIRSPGRGLKESEGEPVSSYRGDW